MNKKIIVGLGEILWDMFPDKSVLGGAPANFAYHAGQLGYESYAVSAIGKDNLGKETLDSLRSKGLNHLISEVDYPTGTVSVELDSKGVPSYIIHQNVAWDNIPLTEEMISLAKRTNCVCFGSLAQRSEVSKNTIIGFINNMPLDSLKVFDINLRQHYYSKEVVEDSLKQATILKLNEDEVVIIADILGYAESDEEQLCKSILDRYCLELVILTKGTEGSYVFTSQNVSYQPTPKVEVADTVGAGDAFTAAFVSSYMKGNKIEDAHRLAVEVSAFVCTQHGAMPILPDRYRNIY